MTQTTKASPEVAYLCRALKAPSLAPSFERLAERVRSQEWTHQIGLPLLYFMRGQVSAHQTNGGELRIKAARLPTRKTIKDFDFTFQRSLKQDTVLHLGHLGVHRGEVVLEDAGWGCPAECSVGSVVIVEMHEPGVGAGPLGF